MIFFPILTTIFLYFCPKSVNVAPRSIGFDELSSMLGINSSSYVPPKANSPENGASADQIVLSIRQNLK